MEYKKRYLPIIIIKVLREGIQTLDTWDKYLILLDKAFFCLLQITDI